MASQNLGTRSAGLESAFLHSPGLLFIGLYLRNDGFWQMVFTRSSSSSRISCYNLPSQSKLIYPFIPFTEYKANVNYTYYCTTQLLLPELSAIKTFAIYHEKCIIQNFPFIAKYCLFFPLMRLSAAAKSNLPAKSQRQLGENNRILCI